MLNFHNQKPPNQSGQRLEAAKRLDAIDALRGIVMVLMTVDHASYAFNAGRYVTDSAGWYIPGSFIPIAQFFTRWVTHLCAPTFLYLAGFVLAMSVARRQAKGEPERKIDGFILKRGVLIMMLDPIWMRVAFGGTIVFQVLYAIGASLCCMSPLRRMGTRSLFAISLGLLIFGEGLAGICFWLAGWQQPGPVGVFLVTGGPIAENIFVLYPLLPWLTYMILGWVLGSVMVKDSQVNRISLYLKTAAIFLVVFVLIRGLNSYGNMGLYRDSLSVVQWLHVSKYPPGLSFSTLELGIMFLLLAFLFIGYRKRSGATANPLLVFGRVPLFFYLIHVHLLVFSARMLHVYRAGSLLETFAATLIALLVMYPICRWYGKIKDSQRFRLLRYL